MVQDKDKGPTRLFLGGLKEGASRTELEDEFGRFCKNGVLKEVWIARRPPGFGFILFESRLDAEDALREMDGQYVCGNNIRVELARQGAGGSGGGGNRNRSPPRRSYGGDSGGRYNDRGGNYRNDRGDDRYSDRGGNYRNDRGGYDDRGGDRFADRGRDGYGGKDRYNDGYDQRRPMRRSPSPPPQRRRSPPARSRSPRRR